LRALIFALATAAACVTRQPFPCSDDTECAIPGGQPVQCVAGSCAFFDSDCDSGFRYGSLAGSLSDSCTPAPDRSCFVGVATGEYHSCALRADGTAQCWGANFKGQLGDETGVDRHVPVEVHGLAGATQLAGGGAHTCAIVNGGTVECWGASKAYQLGDGTSDPHPTPAATLPMPSPAVEIGGGDLFTLALLQDGEVWWWGTVIPLSDSPTPMLSTVPVAIASGAVHIAAGRVDACYLATDGSVWCFGEEAGTTSPVMALAAAPGRIGISMRENVACVLATDGSYTCVPGNAGTGVIDGATVLGAGASHDCALLATGSAVCWGDNSLAQLGKNGVPYSASPVPVEGARGATAISVGSYHSCVLSPPRGVFCWGDDSNGQLGSGSTTDQFAAVPAETTCP
jgi:alpha-tubulin suppressor-like RCC1 family protein